VTFRQYQQDLGPFRDATGLAWSAALGTTKDTALEATRQSLLAGAISRCPDDGVARLGSDTSIERLPSESLDSYRARLRGAWETWSWAGTAYGIRTALNLLGWWGVWLPTVTELAHPDPYTNLWARYYVFITGTTVWDELVWDAFDWDSTVALDASELLWDAWTWDLTDTLWDVDITEEHLDWIRLSLRKWQGARDRVARLVFTFNAVLWDTEVWDAFDWDAGGWPTVIGGAWTWDGGADWDTNAWDASYFD
jgi:hypothetical protein